MRAHSLRFGKVTRRSLRKARSVANSLLQLPTSDYSSGTSETASEKEVEDNLPPPIKLVTVPCSVDNSSSTESCVSLSSDIAPSAIPQTKQRVCPFCPFITKFRNVYLKHLTCHERVPLSTSSDEKTDKNQLKKCPHCNFATRAQGRVELHMKTHFNFSKYLSTQGIEISHGMVWEPSDQIAIEVIDQNRDVS